MQDRRFPRMPTAALTALVGSMLLCSVAFAASMGGRASAPTGDFVLPLVGVVVSLAGALVSAFSVAMRQTGKQTDALLEHLREDRKTLTELVRDERTARERLVATQDRIDQRLDRIDRHLQPPNPR